MLKLSKSKTVNMFKNNSENYFKSLWENEEKKSKQPLFARKLVIIDYKKFSKKVFYGNKKTKQKLVNSLYSGDVYLLKKAFTKKFCKDLIKGAWKIKKTM